MSHAVNLKRFILSSFTLLLVTISSYASHSVVLVANSSHFSLLHRIETSIDAQMPHKPHLIRLEAEDLVDANQLNQHCGQSCNLIVAVGSQATKAVLETKTSYPILSILIRKHAFEDMVNHFVEGNGNPPNISAIYLDQPFKRQMNLIHSLLKNAKTPTVGLLLGPTSQRYQNILEDMVKIYPFKLHIMTVNNQDKAIAAMDVLLEEVNLIWAIPDSAIYNARTARGLLLSAYRKKVPFIGFSRTYVSNGALAAVYSTPKQIAAQTAEHIVWLLNQEMTYRAPSIFLDSFATAVNYQVARSIGMDVESEANLNYALQLQACEENDKLECQDIFNTDFK